MAHQISFNAQGKAEIAYAGATPWHGLGTKVDSLQTAAEMLTVAGLNWQVELAGIQLADTATAIPTHYAVRRVDTGSVLGIVTDRYVCVQNHQATDVADALVTEGGAHVEVAGALGHGERCWLLAHIPADFEVTRGDAVKTYFLLAWGHDGKHGVAGKLTPIRVVCNNTLTQALGVKWSKTAEIYLRHTGDAKLNIEQAQRALGLVRKQAERTAEAYQLMAATKLSDPRAYFAGVFPAPPRPDDSLLGDEYGEKLAKWEAHQREVLSLYDGRGAGSELEGVKGTVWGGYNAVTEWTDHVYPVLQSGKVSTVRQTSVLLGAYQDTKAKALAAGLELCGAA